MCLLVFLGLASEVSASSWTCQKAELTRQVVVFYPEAPARSPCKVFYTKPKENVLPRALWEAKNTQNYCEHKAAEFIEKLSLLGWRCFNDDLEKMPLRKIRGWISVQVNHQAHDTKRFQPHGRSENRTLFWWSVLLWC